MIWLYVDACLICLVAIVALKSGGFLGRLYQMCQGDY